MQRTIQRHGFAFLVFVALACASLLAGSAAVPEPVPDYARQSEEIYRLEIGAAFFVAFYLAVMALILALGGSGFAELGTQGLKARKVITQQESTRQKRLDYRVLQKLQLLEQRLEKLEGER